MERLKQNGREGGYKELRRKGRKYGGNEG